MSVSIPTRGEGRNDGDGDDDATTGLSPAVLQVLTANRDRFLAFLERRVGPPDIAEEILQDAFVRSITRGGALRADESAVAWFYRLLRNAIVDHQRHTSAAQRKLVALGQEAAASGGAAPDRELIDTICACVTSLIRTLKPAYAAAIERVDLNGDTLASYAAAAAVTPGNAAVRLFRARQALRRRVEQSCGTCATHGCYQCECQAEPHVAQP
ncbi:MAG: RNA polymerase sigma factor [Verrucomicrobiota bacterium]